MEILWGNKYLAFIDEIVVFLNANEFKLQTVWLVNFRSLTILHVIVLNRRVVAVNPMVPVREECWGDRPWSKLNVLICVFTKKIFDDVQLCWCDSLLLSFCGLRGIKNCRYLRDPLRNRFGLRRCHEVLDQLSLGEVDETVVAKFMITNLAFVDGAESLVIAFMALVLFFAVGLKENKLGFRIVVRDSTIKLFDTHFVETTLFVNEGSTLLVFEQLDHQWQLFQI